MTIQNTDTFLVSRGGLNYKTEAQDLMAIQDTDLLLVQRGGTNYKVTGEEVKQYAQSSPENFYSYFDYYTAPFSSPPSPQQGNMQTGENCICALTADGIFRTTDGLNWTKVSDAESRGGNSFSTPQGSSGLAYGGNGVWLAYDTPNLGSVRSEDDGVTWESVTLPAPSAGFGGIAGRQNGSQSTFIIAPYTAVGPPISTDSIGHSSIDGGLTWTTLTNTFPVVVGSLGSGAGCVNIVAATLDSQAVYAALIRGGGLGVSSHAMVISTDFGQTWNNVPGAGISGSVLDGAAGLGGGDGALSLSVFSYSNVTGYNTAYNVYLNSVSGSAIAISQREVFNAYVPGGGGEGGCTALVSGAGAVLTQGYEGAAQLIEIGSSPQNSILVKQPSAVYNGCAAVYFKGRFYYWDPYSGKIFFTRLAG